MWRVKASWKAFAYLVVQYAARVGCGVVGPPPRSHPPDARLDVGSTALALAVACRTYVHTRLELQRIAQFLCACALTAVRCIVSECVPRQHARRLSRDIVRVRALTCQTHHKLDVLTVLFLGRSKRLHTETRSTIGEQL